MLQQEWDTLFPVSQASLHVAYDKPCLFLVSDHSCPSVQKRHRFNLLVPSCVGDISRVRLRSPISQHNNNFSIQFVVHNWSCDYISANNTSGLQAHTTATNKSFDITSCHVQPPHIPLRERERGNVKMASLSLNGGNKLGELELLAADQLLSKLILWLKGLFSFLLSLISAQPASVAPHVRLLMISTDSENNDRKWKG